MSPVDSIQRADHSVGPLRFPRYAKVYRYLPEALASFRSKGQRMLPNDSVMHMVKTWKGKSSKWKCATPSKEMKSSLVFHLTEGTRGIQPAFNQSQVSVYVRMTCW